MKDIIKVKSDGSSKDVKMYTKEKIDKLFAAGQEITKDLTACDIDLYFRNNKLWHAYNDGHNSGLDADKLDGKHAGELLAYRGALVNYAPGGYQWNYPVVFDTVIYDTDDFFDINDTQTKFIIPPGVSKVRLSASLILYYNYDPYAYIYKNAEIFIGLPYYGTYTEAQEVEYTSNAIRLFSAIVDVTEGDYFQVFVSQDVGGTEFTWFAVEVIE